MLRYDTLRYDGAASVVLQVIFSSSRVVIDPSASVLAPMIRGEPDMEGLLLGSRELLCLSSQISRTLVSCSSLSKLYLLGESVNCQMQGESVVWWSNFILSPRKTGGFFRGARHVTSSSRQSGADTSSRPLTGTGARHVTSLPSDRGSTQPRRCRLPGYIALSATIRQQVFAFADSIRSYSVD
jgi:hypothetical protein